MTARPIRSRRPGSVSATAAAAAEADARRHYRQDRAEREREARTAASDPAPERIRQPARYRATVAIDDEDRRTAYVLAVARAEVALQDDSLRAAAAAAGITPGEARAWSKDPRIRRAILEQRQEALGHLSDRTTALIARCIEHLTADMDAGKLQPDSRMIKALAELLRTVSDRAGLQPAVRYESPPPPIDASLEDLSVAELRQRLLMEHQAMTGSGLNTSHMISDTQAVDIADGSDEAGADLHHSTTTGGDKHPDDPDDDLPGWMA